MLRLARIPRWLVVMPLFAALASAAPLLRWCPVPWNEVTVEALVACERQSGDCARSCTATDSPPPCAEHCPVSPAPEHGRAFCVDAPFPALRGAGSPGTEVPDACAAIPVAGAIAPSASAASRPIAPERFRPDSRPPNLPPPVRGPPVVA